MFAGKDSKDPSGQEICGKSGLFIIESKGSAHFPI